MEGHRQDSGLITCNSCANTTSFKTIQTKTQPIKLLPQIRPPIRQIYSKNGQVYDFSRTIDKYLDGPLKKLMCHPRLRMLKKINLVVFRPLGALFDRTGFTTTNPLLLYESKEMRIS